MKKNKKISRSVMTDIAKEYIGFQGEQIAHMFERIEEPARMAYYDNVWTLVQDNRYDTSAGFVAKPETTKLGYISLPKEMKTLNLVDGHRKIFVPLTSSVYHFLAEDVADIVRVVTSEEYSDLEIIIEISGITEFLYTRSDYDMYWLLLKSFKDKKIRHKVINIRDFDAVYIDHFFLASNGFTEFSRFPDIFEYFLDYIKDKDVKPTRKVYLSRQKVPVPEFHDYVDPDTGEPKRIKPVRIDDESRLEKLFSKLGFEIVYPEDFKDFEEQLNFFYSVKTVASITSSGLTNAIFMQPGGTIIEVISPLTARPISNGEPGYLNREFHNYYKNIAVSKRHFYIGLPNGSSKMDDLEDFLLMNENVKKVLKQVK